MEQKTFQIDEVAAKTGLTKRTLRYYEDLNLIMPLRKESGYRLYSEEDLAKIFRIKEIREGLGFCLNDVREVLELEKNLQAVFYDKITDPELIAKSLAMLQRQLALIEKKEQSIAKAKTKYLKTFNELKLLNGKLKAETPQTEDI